MTSPKKIRIDDKQYTFKPFRVPKYRIKFENAKRLSDIDGYLWYTPAALYLWGRFSETNLGEIVSRTDIKIFWYKFDKPIFQNFDVDWNHLLWASSVEDWIKLVDGILETVQFDIPKKELYQYGLQSLDILDPLYIDTNRIVDEKTPVVPIKSFGVLSNKRQIAFDSSVKPSKKTIPSMSTSKPLISHVRAGNLLFSDDSITQDDAFVKYKRIMQQLSDATHKLESQQKFDEAVRRKKNE